MRVTCTQAAHQKIPLHLLPLTTQHEDEIGVITVFFLRALRICSEEFLNDECNSIVKASSHLMYPLDLLCKLREKAEYIWVRSTDTGHEEEEKEKVKEEDCVVVLYARTTDPITRFFTRNGARIVNASRRKIRDCVAGNSSGKVSYEDNFVYRIPCGGCSSAYYGETLQGVKRRNADNRGNLQHHRTTNLMVIHAEEHDHLPD